MADIPPPGSNDPPLCPPLIDQVDNVENPGVGGGNCSNTEIVPDIDFDPLRSGLSGQVTMILAGLASLSKAGDIRRNDIRLEQLMSEFEALMTETEKQSIVINQEKERTLIDAKTEKLEKAVRKLQKAMRREGNKRYNIIKASLSMATAIGSFAVGAVLVSAGHPSGPAMLATGVVQMVMATDAIVEASTGESMFYMAAKATGASDKKAAEVAMATKLALVAALIILAVASLGLAYYAGAPELATSVQLMQTLTNLATFGTSIGVALCDAQVGYKGLRSAKMREDEASARSGALELDGELQILRDITEILIQAIKKGQEAATKMVISVSEIRSEEANLLAKRSFTA